MMNTIKIKPLVFDTHEGPFGLYYQADSIDSRFVIESLGIDEYRAEWVISPKVCVRYSYSTIAEAVKWCNQCHRDEMTAFFRKHEKWVDGMIQIM